VISLREEDMGEMEEVKRFKVLERLRPVNEYLTGLGLAEVIVPNLVPIENSRSYLALYTPYFSQLSYLWLSFNVFLPVALIYYDGMMLQVILINSLS
jgi:glycine cleavage system pyridoxal-binding protein P